LGQLGGCRWIRFLIQVSEYLVDHRRVFNTGDYFDGTTTFATGFNIDVKYALQSLRPGGHAGMQREAVFWLFLEYFVVG